MGRKIALAWSVSMLAVWTPGCATFVAGLGPQGPPRESPSAQRLEPGPYPVHRFELELVDASRSTPPNGDYAGAPTRTLVTTIWVPTGNGDPCPLVVYSHGFLSGRREGAYLAEHLATHGYVVAALDHPLSRRGAPGGAGLRDLAHQPGDVRFVIDSLLAPEPMEPSLLGRIDPLRIAAVGLSLGGLTATLAAFHPELRDPRIRAAVSIAGPAAFLSRRFFASAQVPFLMIAGTEDAIVPYSENAAVVLERSPSASLLTLMGASHAGFASNATSYFQFARHPDKMACGFLEGRLPTEPEDLEEANPLDLLGGPEQGIDFEANTPLPCSRDQLPRAMRPRRQLIVLRLAVRAFLDSQLGPTSETRRAAWDYLVGSLPSDFPDVRFAAAAVAGP